MYIYTCTGKLWAPCHSLCVSRVAINCRIPTPTLHQDMMQYYTKFVACCGYIMLQLHDVK